MKKFIKKLIVNSKPLRKWLIRLSDDFPKVLVYHRFSEAGSKHPNKISSDVFRWQLEEILKNYQVVTFCECLDHYYKCGTWPGRCVVITVDDGYRDFYQFGYPVLHALGISATFFVTTNFIEKKMWLWPDRLAYALSITKNNTLNVEITGNKCVYQLNGEVSVSAAWKVLSDYCIGIPDHEKKIFIENVEDQLGVSLPAQPPEQYAAVNWDELREMAQNNIEIGSHTLNHPILSRINQKNIEDEVKGSKKVLEQKLGMPVRTFCYPNSRPGDINDEAIKLVVEAGYIGAVFSRNLGRWEPYRVPRMGVSNDKCDFLSKLYGLESVGLRVRTSLGRSSV